MKSRESDLVREQVRSRYADIAESNESCCSSDCCTPTSLGDGTFLARLGYSEDELATVPVGSNMGLGCGNPRVIAALQPGEVVLDLGSGGGFDCFLAARQVGAEGKVIGVDMTPEMIAKARANGRKSEFENVEFRLGEIEHLPVADSSIDVIVSNCVINLSPEKDQVFQEAYRVLRPQGRLAVSDVIAIRPLPESVKKDMDAHCGCVAGAVTVAEIEQMLRRVGFAKISIEVQEGSDQFIRDWFPGTSIENHVRAAAITAYK